MQPNVFQPTAFQPGGTASGSGTTIAIGTGSILYNGQNVTAQTQVFPTQDTTYTCTAIGPRSTDTRTVSVKVTPLPPGGTPTDGKEPVIKIAGGPIIETNVRQNSLDASQTISPSGDVPLTFQWSSWSP